MKRNQKAFGNRVEQKIIKEIKTYFVLPNMTSTRNASREMDNLGIDTVGFPLHLQLKGGKQKTLNPKILLKDYIRRIINKGAAYSHLLKKPFAIIHWGDKTKGVRARKDEDTMVHMTFKTFMYLMSTSSLVELNKENKEVFLKKYSYD